MERPLFSVAISLLVSFWCCSEFITAQLVSHNSPDCPDIYRRYSIKHSYCQPKNASCNIVRSLLTRAEIEQVLKLHNSFRSVVATQQEKGGANQGLPPASNMLLMEWDNELASVAQRYADRCIYAHDKPNERRVRNFGTGQNIAIQRLTGQNLKAPPPDWSFAVGDWYEEIIYFSSDMICNFPKPQPAQGEYRHFSQVVWADSFRVGCGYVLFQHGNTYTRLYICNYGPTGNIYGGCVYEKGSACSNCPVNTQCTAQSQYPGLCQRTNSMAPYHPVKQPNLFDCNFMHPSKADCLININGPTNWYIIPALGGYYLETVLQPGQNSTVIFSKKINGTANAKSMCVQLVYRKGPNLAKDPQSNGAKEIFTIPSMNDYTYVQNLPSYDGEARHTFSTYNLTLQWHEATEMKITFAVPNGSPPQYLNVDSILALNDGCQNHK